MVYYEIVNTVSEYRSEVVSRWSTLELAKEKLKDCADQYRDKGTGIIIEVNIFPDNQGKIIVTKEEVYSK